MVQKARDIVDSDLSDARKMRGLWILSSHFANSCLAATVNEVLVHKVRLVRPQTYFHVFAAGTKNAT